MKLPCGRCIGCRIDRSRQWAVRCVHEASLRGDNSYVTLTYSPAKLPFGGTLDKYQFVTFMKRLRKAIWPKKVRYFHCGEYGEVCRDCDLVEKYCSCEVYRAGPGRPHHHALLFGLEFPDKVLWKRIRGNPVYISKMLDEIWGNGFCSIGAVSFQSAAYVARYVMKKQNGDLAEKHYERVLKETGEVVKLQPEYLTMSLRPGIADEWFRKHKDDVFPDDFCVIGGKKFKTPRFYDKLIRRLDGEEVLEQIKAVREESALRRAHDSAPERLSSRETVQLEKLKRLRREL